MNMIIKKAEVGVLGYCIWRKYETSRRLDGWDLYFWKGKMKKNGQWELGREKKYKK